MATVSTAEFRNGMVVQIGPDLMEIVEFQHVKPGKGGAFVRTRFKNILTGRVLERTFRSGEKMDEVRLLTEKYQYLYNDGDIFHFMHPQTFEQIEISAAIVGDKKAWMKENSEVQLLFHGNKVLTVSVPVAVELIVAKSDPGVQGDRTSGATKPATLETGDTIQVPLFINEGDKLKVDTRTGEYVERVN